MNGALLDTHAFLWIVTDDPQLSRRAKSFFLDPENRIFLSVASIWEMAIKRSLGRLTIPTPLAKFVGDQAGINGISILDVQTAHAGAVADLPFHHRDPFDRLIVAQAREEELAVISCDRALKKYGVRTIW